MEEGDATIVLWQGQQVTESPTEQSALAHVSELAESAFTHQTNGTCGDAARSQDWSQNLLLFVVQCRFGLGLQTKGRSIVCACPWLYSLTHELCVFSACEAPPGAFRHLCTGQGFCCQLPLAKTTGIVSRLPAYLPMTLHLPSRTLSSDL